MQTADLDSNLNLLEVYVLIYQNLFPPPDTTTFALVNSGRSLFVRFCSNHSETPAAGVAATAVRSQERQERSNENISATIAGHALS